MHCRSITAVERHGYITPRELKPAEADPLCHHTNKQDKISRPALFRHYQMRGCLLMVIVEEGSREREAQVTSMRDGVQPSFTCLLRASSCPPAERRGGKRVGGRMEGKNERPWSLLPPFKHTRRRRHIYIYRIVSCYYVSGASRIGGVCVCCCGYGQQATSPVAKTTGERETL